MSKQSMPVSLKDYLSGTTEGLRVWQWIWRELMLPQARLWTFGMWFMNLLQHVTLLLAPVALYFMVDTLTLQDFNAARWWFVGLVVTKLIERVVHGYELWCQQQALVANKGSIDQGFTKFLSMKSVGQLLREILLSIAHLQEGRNRIHTGQSQFLDQIISVVNAFLLNLVILFCVYPVAGLIMVVTICLHVSLSLYDNYRTLVEKTPIDQEFNQLYKYRAERWSNMDRVKNAVKEDEELHTMQKKFNDTAEKELALYWRKLTRIIVPRGSIGSVGFLLSLGYGVWMVTEGVWSAHLLIPLYFWTLSVSQQIWRLSQFEHELTWNLPPIKTVQDALMLPADIVENRAGPQVPSDQIPVVSLRNVYYSYPATKIPVLNNVSLDIKPGEKVALIGGNGCGKTTLLRLIMQHMNPNQGKIYIGEHPLTELNLASWRQRAAYVPQNPRLFENTLRYNLLYELTAEQQAQITDEELWKIVQRLQVDFGTRLDQGLDTMIGSNLSGGQAQRVLLAAAAIKRPLFVGIDEAMSNLDADAARKMKDGLQEVLGTASMLVIAHSFSTLEMCNKFVVLGNASSPKPLQPQVEAVAYSFDELHDISPTFRQLAQEQNFGN